MSEYREVLQKIYNVNGDILTVVDFMSLVTRNGNRGNLLKALSDMAKDQKYKKRSIEEK
jgi:hypothetical protein